MKYTQIPSNTFQNLQMNAGILVDSFQPSEGTVGRLLGATSGGVNFHDNITYTDFGDDIDNCPKNMMELKRIDTREVTMGGTFITIEAASARMMVGVGDIDTSDATHIVPRNELLTSDFTELWWIGDYSDVNTGDNAGFLAIRLMNALNTNGFQIQSTDKGKGQFAFNFTGHYSISNQDLVPYEIYIARGEAPSVELTPASVSVAVGANTTLTATTTNPDDATVSWSTSDPEIATVEDGVVTGVAEGTATITAIITVDGRNYTDTCGVTVTATA